MLPQKIFKIRIFNLAENEFQTTESPDFSMTFGILSQIPWLSDVSFKFPDFSRFSRSVATLPSALANGIYASQLIRYARCC